MSTHHKKAGIHKKPVGAHYGLRDWLAQRFTAIVIVAASVIFFIALCIVQPSDFAQWHAFMQRGWVRLLLLLVVVAVAWHAFIGGRDIYMDYLKPTWLRLGKTIGLIIYLLVCVLWALQILL